MDKQDSNDFWAPWRVKASLKEKAFDWLIDRALEFFILLNQILKASLKEKAFDWLIDRALEFFILLDEIEIWWSRKRKNAK